MIGTDGAAIVDKTPTLFLMLLRRAADFERLRMSVKLTPNSSM